MSVLSVDFGTSNTVAALSAHGRPPRVIDVDGASMMPSALFAGPDGLVAGREAERRARMDPARYEPNPKRRIDDGDLLLGDVVVPVTDAVAAVLRKVADETQRQLGGAKPAEVRLTHPAQWGPVRRNVLLAAARLAGLGSNLTLVPEPVAAAAHYATFTGRAIGQGEAVAVYDLGAGTFDVAVVGATDRGYTVLAENGLQDLGGLDVDQALLDHISGQVRQRDPESWQRLLSPMSTSDRRAARALRDDVRAAKEALSAHPQTEVPLPDPFGDVLVTRPELEQLVRPNLTRSVELLAATIKGTGFAPDGLAGIYLVGGSSRIPLVAALIAEGLRVVPASLDQPETAVALGAHHMTAEGISPNTNDLPPDFAQQGPPSVPFPAPSPADGGYPVSAAPQQGQATRQPEAAAALPTAPHSGHAGRQPEAAAALPTAPHSGHAARQPDAAGTYPVSAAPQQGQATRQPDAAGIYPIPAGSRSSGPRQPQSESAPHGDALAPRQFQAAPQQARPEPHGFGSRPRPETTPPDRYRPEAAAPQRYRDDAPSSQRYRDEPRSSQRYRDEPPSSQRSRDEPPQRYRDEPQERFRSESAPEPASLPGPARRAERSSPERRTPVALNTAIPAGIVLFLMALGFAVQGYHEWTSAMSTSDRWLYAGVTVLCLTPIALTSGFRLVRGVGGHVLGALLGGAIVAYHLARLEPDWNADRIAGARLDLLLPWQWQIGGPAPLILGIGAVVLCLLPSTWRSVR